MRRNYVVGFAFPKYLKGVGVVLILKNRPANQKGRLNGIGGEIKPGETSLEAMIREFREETGVETKREDWRMFAQRTRRECNIAFYTCTVYAAAFRNRDASEEVAVVDATKLPDNVLPDLRWLIPLALDASILPPIIMDAT